MANVFGSRSKNEDRQTQVLEDGQISKARLVKSPQVLWICWHNLMMEHTTHLAKGDRFTGLAGNLECLIFVEE
jgi:hypothetical protein